MKEVYIEMLCNQFSCNRTELFQMLGEYQINNNHTLIFVFGAIVVISFIISILTIILGKKRILEEETVFIILLFSVVTLLMSIPGLSYNIYHYYSFVNSPEIAAQHFIDNHFGIIEF